MLPIIAMSTMLLDHVGIAFLDNNLIFRLIGRLAFPLYAYGIVQGYNFTSSKGKYFKRLLILAILSQIPFMIALNQWILNVIFTFLIGLICLYIADNIKKYISIPLILVIAASVHFIADYGSYCLFLILIYKYFNSFKMLSAHFVLNLIYGFLFGWWLQIPSILATIIIMNRHKLKNIKVNKLFYRSFYPAHLTIIMFLSKV